MGQYNKHSLESYQSSGREKGTKDKPNLLWFPNHNRLDIGDARRKRKNGRDVAAESCHRPRSPPTVRYHRVGEWDFDNFSGLVVEG